MAYYGFKVLDCDLHVCEPVDLWQRHIEAKYRDDAPVGRPLEDRPFHDLNIFHRGETYSPQARFPDAAIDDEAGGYIHLARCRGRYDQYVEFQQRGWGPDTQLEAMDIEGIDAAVLFPSLALTTMGKVYDDDGLAAAIACAPTTMKRTPAPCIAISRSQKGSVAKFGLSDELCAMPGRGVGA